MFLVDGKDIYTIIFYGLDILYCYSHRLDNTLPICTKERRNIEDVGRKERGGEIKEDDISGAT